MKIPNPAYSRRFPIGAEVRGNGTHFRVWAPRAKKLKVKWRPRDAKGNVGTLDAFLNAEGNGYFSASIPEVRDGDLYGFELSGDKKLYPDPASRFQPQGPGGLSQVVNPNNFKWTDQKWRGISAADNQILYEMHIGTFTQPGTWKSAEKQLPRLAQLGITVLEVMPVADFPGEFGWGYDGVNVFAPTRLYGTPNDFRSFVNAAHAVGLGVILDVVYNHVGCDDCYFQQFSKNYFTQRYDNEWGEPFNFDGKDSAPVREFFITNAEYWITEFHVDGLRFDATQSMHDCSTEHILAEISRRVRKAAGKRRLYLIGENEPQQIKLTQPLQQGGYNLDALWNDDFHHSAMVAATGRNEAYYTDYLGAPQEFVSAAKYGYLYQGQYYAWQNKKRGSASLDIEPRTFINYLQNHDQIANSAQGQRIHLLTDMGRYRALTALLLLMPGTPMLFQGQEFASNSPFLYFADNKPDLAKNVRRGRTQFLKQFPSIAGTGKTLLSKPDETPTFERSKLSHDEIEMNKQVYTMHRDLIALRKDRSVFRPQNNGKIEGAVLGTESFLIRYFGVDEDALLVVNLGRDQLLKPMAQPLLSPPQEAHWRLILSTDDPRYGGNGVADLQLDAVWHLPGHSAFVLLSG